jgi:hypothetical protein
MSCPSSHKISSLRRHFPLRVCYLFALRYHGYGQCYRRFAGTCCLPLQGGLVCIYRFWLNTHGGKVAAGTRSAGQQGHWAEKSYGTAPSRDRGPAPLPLHLACWIKLYIYVHSPTLLISTLKAEAACNTQEQNQQHQFTFCLGEALFFFHMACPVISVIPSFSVYAY